MYAGAYRFFGHPSFVEIGVHSFANGEKFVNSSLISFADYVIDCYSQLTVRLMRESP